MGNERVRGFIAERTEARFRFTTVDVVALGINTFLAALHFVFASTGANLWIGVGFLSANGLILALAAADGRGSIRQGTIGHFVRLFFVQVLYAPYFTRVIALSQLVWGGKSLDHFFYSMEQRIFGAQLSVLLPERFGHLQALNVLFFFAYFAFYALLCLPGWILFLKRRYREAERALFIITAAFGFLYVWYVFFPVHGPKYHIDALHAKWYRDLDGYLFAWIMRTIFRESDLAGAAVPSSHVAISTISMILMGRYVPRALWIAAPVTALLYVSTVYLYAHYAVDVILGLAVVPLLWWGATSLYRALSRSRISSVTTRRS